MKQVATQAYSAYYLFHISFLLGLFFFDLEDGGDMLLGNIGNF
jgi:hypothetical protein